MKTYTTDEVIEIVNRFLSSDVSVFHDIDPEEFANYLKDKEQSQLPVKDQLHKGKEVWVRDINDFAGDIKLWFKRPFHSFFNNNIKTYGDKNQSIKNSYIWDEYSLTDPNK